MKPVRLVRFVEEHAGQNGVEMKGPWSRVTDYVSLQGLSGTIYGPSTIPGMDREELWATCLEGVVHEVTFCEDGDLYTIRGSEDDESETMALSRHRVEIDEPEEDVAETPRFLANKFARARRLHQKSELDEYYPELS